MKKCKECGREEWGFLSVLDKDGYCPRCAVVHNGEKVKKLQEQLDEANRIIQISIALVDKRPREMMRRYLKKWGVK